MQRGCVARPKADFRRSCAGPIRAAHCLQRERLATEIETGLNPKGIQLRCRGGAARGDPIRLVAVLLGTEKPPVFFPILAIVKPLRLGAVAARAHIKRARRPWAASEWKQMRCVLFWP